VEEWAQQQGCSTIVIQSREGWLKVMKASGYSPYQASIRKDLF
jgi:N-acyl-L-homoserine lactone synthetase